MTPRHGMLYPPATVSRTSFEQTYKKHLASEQRREVMSTLRATLRRDTTLGEVVDAAGKVGWSEAMGELTLADLANALVRDDDTASAETARPRTAKEVRDEPSPTRTTPAAASLAAELDASLGQSRRAGRLATTEPAEATEAAPTQRRAATKKTADKTAKKVAAKTPAAKAPAAKSDTKPAATSKVAAGKKAQTKSATTKAAPTKVSARAASTTKATPAKAPAAKATAAKTATAKKKTSRR